MKNLFKLCVLAVAVVFLAGCSNTAQIDTYTLEDLQDKRIGILLGGATDRIVNEKFPDATIVHFNEQMEAITALQSGQVDGAVSAYPSAFLTSKNIPELTWIEEPLTNDKAGVGIKKGNTELLNKVNACIEELRRDGILIDMQNRWYNMENPNYKMPDISLPYEGTPLIIGVAADREPACFLSSGSDVIGFDSELAHRIASYLNRPIEFVDMRFAALVPALESGKVNIVVSNLIITEERKQALEMSEPYFDTPLIMIVKKGM